MITVNLREAQGHLAQLFEEATHGEEVLITREDGLTCKIVPFEAPRPKPVFGSARGQIRIREDFDAPLEDFKDYEP
jgi:antitoxin (DNA-binding transcriptional repressor) of toxin-antitoxin stability system